AINDDAGAGATGGTIKGNAVSRTCCRAANSITGSLDDIQTMLTITERTRAVDLRPDKVALHHNARHRTKIYPVSVVARDYVARTGRCSADSDVSRTSTGIADRHTITCVAQVRRAGDISSNEVALN